MSSSAGLKTRDGKKTRVRRVKRWILATVVASTMATGCTRLNLPIGTYLPKKPRPHGAFEGGFEADPDLAEKLYYASREAYQNNSVVLQVVGDDAPVRVLPLPAADSGRSLRVSNLLGDTGVLLKLGGVEAELYRQSPGQVGGARMAIKLEDGIRIRPESDYALQPGDRIRVQKIKSGPIKSLFDVTAS